MELQSYINRYFPARVRDEVFEYMQRDCHVNSTICEVPWTGKNFRNFPRVKLVIGDREEFVLTVMGLTVGEMRASCHVPADWTAILDDERLVADNYPILSDCCLLFRASDGEAAAAMCRTIRFLGRCEQREDDQNWIGITELRTTITDKELRMLSEKELRTLLRREGVRTRKPLRQRLEVHAGDWLHFLARQARQQERVLDKASDPAEVKELTDDMKGAARLIRQINNDG